MIDKKERLDEATKSKFGGFIGDMPSLVYSTEFVENIMFKSEEDEDIISIPNPMILQEVVKVSEFDFEKWPKTLTPATSLYFSIDMKKLVSEVSDQLEIIKATLRKNDK